MGLDERHYNINTLNKLFAVAAVILLTAVGLLLLNDYFRSWKNYQTDFRNQEITVTRVKLDGEENTLSHDPAYIQLQDKLQQAQQDFQKQCSKDQQNTALTQIKELTTTGEILKQQYRVVKAQFDTAKFQFEEISAKGHGDVQIAKIRYQSLEQKSKQLNQKIQKIDASLNVHQSMLDECGQSLKELESQQQALTAKMNILTRKLEKIDPNEMNLLNRFANIFRNLPIIDLANPTQKVKQIVLKDVRENNNFLNLPRVDRCTTCHLGIDNPDYQDAEQPLRTHPNLERYVSKDSPHSLEEFGCTVCHDGRGRGTDFNSTAHTPSSEQQAQEWKEKYGWEHMHHWDKPMLAKPYVQASCLKCHSGQSTITGADKLNLGLNLIERAGCYACHNIDKYKDWPKPGPSLLHLASKVNKDWTYLWLNDPKSFRHTTWMPSYFNQSNNSDPQSKLRSEQEIHAITAYLFAESDGYKMSNVPGHGNALKGRELLAAVGCLGCHMQTNDTLIKPVRSLNQLKREQGPNLVGFGNKTSKVWIYDWLKNPNRYHPETRMPDLRLSDQEAADIAEYLYENTIASFNQSTIPPMNEDIISTIVLQFLQKALSPDESAAKVASMKTEEKLHFAGQKLIAQYGCYSCHTIKGFDGFKPIGTDLTEQGSKTVDRLDFGFVHLDHTKEAWYNQKLRDPRTFDKDKIKAPDEKAMMPNFNFTPEEAEAITTVILGLVKDTPGKNVPRTPENLAIEKGQQIVREFNCQGCHTIENDGGAITESIHDWLISYQGKDKTEAQAMVKTFSPPKLSGIGRKIQVQWLFEFLHQPQPVRPWLKVRMPTYRFSAAHVNSLLKYFSALDHEEFPFTDYVDLSLTPDEVVAGQKMFSVDYFDCTKCHIIGEQMPSGTQDTWAPDLGLAQKRLKPGWVSTWLTNPSAVDPTTKMPTFWDPQSFNESGPPDILDGKEDEQIRVLRNYIMSISSHPPIQNNTSVSVSTPAQSPGKK